MQWTKDLFFSDDPLLKGAILEEAKAAGIFSNVCVPIRERDDAQRCEINFQLLKQTNYPSGKRNDPKMH